MGSKEARAIDRNERKRQSLLAENRARAARREQDAVDRANGLPPPPRSPIYKHKLNKSGPLMPSVEGVAEREKASRVARVWLLLV